MARHDRLRPVGSLFGGVSPLRNHEPARSELFVRGAIGSVCCFVGPPVELLVRPLTLRR